MPSLLRARSSDHGFVFVKTSSSRATSSGGHRQANENGSQDRDDKVQSAAAVVKPWADRPWPLIETPAMKQPITHPALYIANEIAQIHNAMLRGLNAIYLQAPHVRQTQDIADFSFFAQSWSKWLLDHHDLKESVMLPGFEAALSVPAGTLTLPRSRCPSAASAYPDTDTAATAEGGDGKDKDAYRGEEETITFFLHRVYGYASATHKDPQAYDATTLQGHLVALADTLVPHLIGQIGLLASMREMCLGSAANTETSNGRAGDIPGPLPMPMTAITRTAPGSPSGSTPVSPSSSTFSSSPTTPASSARHSPPPSLSLFPPTARPHHGKTPAPTTLGAKDVDVVDAEAKDRLTRARALLEADARATKLTRVYRAADARASARMDRFVVPPMIVRLRDVTAPSGPSRLASISPSSRAGMGMGIGMGMAGAVGGGSASEWPGLSIPAVHAIADKLSPRHEGAWRFLPCDVWGRPRELPFLG
ncbi:hypothetical protein F4802DRAFT_558206 [Xylaria palmicola]|nr:hypothetical protein F4802DRAFT_558206 [Xylaria palmicola]